MVIIISNNYRKGHFFASYWKIMATHAKSTLLALLSEGIGGGGEGGGEVLPTNFWETNYELKLFSSS